MMKAETLHSMLAPLAAQQVCVGTSSWKYPGWCGQIYDEQRYQSADNNRVDAPMPKTHASHLRYSPSFLRADFLDCFAVVDLEPLAAGDFEFAGV